MSNSLWPHGLQHARPPCPSPITGACSNSSPLGQWFHPIISSSVIPFSSHLQCFPTSGSFPTCQFFTSGGQSIGVSASTSVLPMNIQDWSPLGWTGWMWSYHLWILLCLLFCRNVLFKDICPAQSLASCRLPLKDLFIRLTCQNDGLLVTLSIHPALYSLTVLTTWNITDIAIFFATYFPLLECRLCEVGTLSHHVPCWIPWAYNIWLINIYWIDVCGSICRYWSMDIKPRISFSQTSEELD